MNKPRNHEATVNGVGEVLLNKRGLAPKLDVSVRTLDDWMRRGWVPYFKIGRAVRFNFDDVIAKLKQYRVN